MLNAYLSFGKKDSVLEFFAYRLQRNGWKLFGSTGTAAYLNTHAISAEVLGDSILNHRVVSLCREVHAGLLAREPQDKAEMDRLGLKFLHMAIVNLYDTEPLIAEKGSSVQAYDEINEKTDIGGPTIARSAIKGGRIVLCDPKPYELDVLVQWIASGCPQRRETLAEQWAEAEQRVATYTEMIARYRKQYLAKLREAL